MCADSVGPTQKNKSAGGTSGLDVGRWDMTGSISPVKTPLDLTIRTARALGTSPIRGPLLVRITTFTFVIAPLPCARAEPRGAVWLRNHRVAVQHERRMEVSSGHIRPRPSGRLAQHENAFALYCGWGYRTRRVLRRTKLQCSKGKVWRKP